MDRLFGIAEAIKKASEAYTATLSTVSRAWQLDGSK
jgi:hypothetical protein